MSALLKTATKWEKAKCSPATSEWRNNSISMQWCMITKEKKKKKKTDICNRNESQKHHAKLKKPDTTDYILYDFNDIKIL